MGKIVTINIAGLDKIQHELEVVPRRDANKILRTALKDGAGEILQGMHREAPKDSGFLDEHFGSRISLKGGGLVAGTAFIGPQGKINYPKRGTGGRGGRMRTIAVASVARFLEFGTSKMPANPFMTRAFESTKESALFKIIGTLRRMIFQERT